MIDEIVEEKKNLEVIKISIESQKHSINEREIELTNQKIIHEAKSNAELASLDKRESIQKMEEMALRKRITEFTIEKQKFDSEKSKFLADKTTFLNLKDSFENQLKDAMQAYEDAEYDKKKAQEYYEEAEKINKLIIEQRNKISNDYYQLNMMQKKYFTERLLIAQERKRLESEKKLHSNDSYENCTPHNIERSHIRNMAFENLYEKDNIVDIPESSEFYKNENQINKKIFDDDVINEIISNNSENNTGHYYKPWLKKSINEIPNYLNIKMDNHNENKIINNDYSVYTKDIYMTYDDDLLNEPLNIPDLI